jgi:hypothetical protein
MTLGTDQDAVCGPEFVHAMRPIAGANVDIEAVRNNLHALGLAVYRIATVHAQTLSDEDADGGDFWGWIEDVQAWIEGIAGWQAGVKAAIDAWAPTTPAEQGVRAALRAVAAPPDAPDAAPTELRGVIR